MIINKVSKRCKNAHYNRRKYVQWWLNMWRFQWIWLRCKFFSHPFFVSDRLISVKIWFAWRRKHGLSIYSCHVIASIKIIGNYGVRGMIVDFCDCSLARDAARRGRTTTARTSEYLTDHDNPASLFSIFPSAAISSLRLYKLIVHIAY